MCHCRPSVAVANSTPLHSPALSFAILQGLVHEMRVLRLLCCLEDQRGIGGGILGFVFLDGCWRKMYTQSAECKTSRPLVEKTLHPPPQRHVSHFKDGASSVTNSICVSYLRLPVLACDTLPGAHWRKPVSSSTTIRQSLRLLFWV